MATLKRVIRKDPPMTIVGVVPKRPKYFCKDCGLDGGCAYARRPEYRAKLIATFGKVHTYSAYFSQLTSNEETVILHVGCREFKNSKDALKHWKGNKNPAGYPRPYAKTLVEAAIKTAKTLKLNWK